MYVLIPPLLPPSKRSVRIANRSIGLISTFALLRATGVHTSFRYRPVDGVRS